MTSPKARLVNPSSQALLQWAVVAKSSELQLRNFFDFDSLVSLEEENAA